MIYILGQEKQIFIQKKENSGLKWHSICSKIVLEDTIVPQVLYSINNGLYCFACRYYCNQNVPYDVNLDCSGTCQCNTQCIFKNCTKIIDNEVKTLNIQTITSFYEILTFLGFKNQIGNNERSFQFKLSSQYCLQRIMFYEDPDIQKQVLSIIPMQSIEDKAKENSNVNCTGYKDELIKSLLAWYKKECMSWLNSPKCSECGEITVYFDTHPPTSEEMLHAAIRTEVYSCKKCDKLSRFPRYNDPAKISQTRIGRCSEYANLFGCILRALDFDVRFIDNFEDHVWNEYWSESLQKVNINIILVDTC
jgi:hypothetical protein